MFDDREILIYEIIIIYLFCVSCFGPSQSYPTTQQIIFYTARDGDFEIYNMDIDGFNSINLTKSPLKNDTYPKFSPDGSQVVFISTQ